MKDSQARADLDRARGICTSLIRRIERLEDNGHQLQDELRAMRRQAGSDHDLLRMVANGPSLATVFRIETELC